LTLADRGAGVYSYLVAGKGLKLSGDVLKLSGDELLGVGTCKFGLINLGLGRRLLFRAGEEGDRPRPF